MHTTIQEIEDDGDSKTSVPLVEVVEDFNAVVGTDSLEATAATNEENELEMVQILQRDAVIRRNQAIFGVGIATILLGFTIVLTRMQHVGEQEMANRAAWLAMVYASGAVLVLLSTFRSLRQKTRLLQRIGAMSNVKDIGLLVGTLRLENTEVKNMTKLCLTKLLPQMKASDIGMLGGKERGILLRQLQISPLDKGPRDLRELFSRSADRREIDFRVAILKAFEQIGTNRELPLVSRLAKGLNYLGSSRGAHIEVRNAAEACLPYLQALTQDQEASGQLLRASSPDAGSATTLLHPVNFAGNELPEEHLRASEFAVGDGSKEKQ